MNRRIAVALLATTALAPLLHHSSGSAQTLVASPFNSGYTGWVDPLAAPARLGNWRLSLNNPTLMETNNANPPTAGGGTNTGLYEPNVLIQNDFSAPANYELSATLRTSDDDLLGLVWNYQDPNNYFRVGIRQQPTSGTFGATEGLSVQKIVNGVVTQLIPSTPMIGSATVTQAMIDGRIPFDLKVAVTGSNYEIFFNNASVGSGTDDALAAGRKIGFQSWAQHFDVATVTPAWGTEVEQVSVKQGATTLYNQSFAARPTAWRPMVTTNAAMVSTATAASKELVGNFGVSINNPWIFQNTNANLSATFGNVDFLGPGVVVNEPGSASFTNYQMQVRIGSTDNDGMGVIVRAQDDNNFYRITFANEATDVAMTTRAPRGMSVQKVLNGVWTELYSDDSNPLFVYTPGLANATPTTGLPMFDLSVNAVGDTLKIQVRDHLGAVFNYPLITDSSNPILSGSVGFHVWGQGDPNTGGGGAYYMGYGGVAGPLVTAIPEPSTLLMTATATMAFVSLRTRRRSGEGSAGHQHDFP